MDAVVGENEQPPVKRQKMLEKELTEEELLVRKEQNDLKLKSRFESIFEKYGKNFDGIGDEIDLETGQIVVDNGHVVGMINEQDAGDLDDISDEHESDEWSEEDDVLTSTLLSQFQQRLKALDSSGVFEYSNRADVPREHSEDEDSLMGDVVLGDKPQENSMEVVSPHRPYSATISLEKENVQREGGGEDKMQMLANGANHPSSFTPRRKVNLYRMPSEPLWRSPLLPKDGNLPAKRERVRSIHTKVASASPKASHDLSSGRGASDKKPEETGDPTAARSFWSHSYFPNEAHLEGDEEANHSQEIESREAEPRRNSRPKRIKPTRIRWSEEDNALLSHLKMDLGVSYDEAAKHFPDRPKKSVVRHWIRQVKRMRNPLPPKPKVTKRIRWKAEQNAELRRLMADPNLTHDDVAAHFADRPKSSTLRHWARLKEKDEQENDDQMEDSLKAYSSDDDQQSHSSEEADSDFSDGPDVSFLPAQPSGRRLSPYQSDLTSHPHPTSASTSKPLAYSTFDSFLSGIESMAAAPEKAPSQKFQPKASTSGDPATFARPAGPEKSDRDQQSHQQGHNGRKSDHQVARSDTETWHGEDGHDRPQQYCGTNRNPQVEKNELQLPNAESEPRPGSSLMADGVPRNPLLIPVRGLEHHVGPSMCDSSRVSHTTQLDVSEDELAGPMIINESTGKTQGKRKSPELMIDPKLLDGTI